jgi:hypothetical protein
MALLVIPCPTGTDNYELQTVLDGATYTLALHWNYRGGFWSLSIADANDNPIVSGVALRINVDVLYTTASFAKPPGSLGIIDASGSGLDPDLDELGKRVQLVYLEAGT